MKELIDIKHPDWLETALEKMDKIVRMARTKKIPSSLLGWMLVVNCLYMLRCIYGSDKETLQGLTLHIGNKEQVLDKAKTLLN